MFHFKLFALFRYCNTSNGAQRTAGVVGVGVVTVESCTQRLLTVEKEYTEILRCTTQSSTSCSPRKELESVETWRFLDPLRQTINKL